MRGHGFIGIVEVLAHGVTSVAFALVVDRRGAGDALRLQVTDHGMHLDREVTQVLYRDDVFLEGEEDLEIAGREGFYGAAVEIGRCHPVRSTIRLAVVVEAEAADREVDGALVTVGLRIVLLPGHLPGTAAVAGGVASAAVERGRVVGIAGGLVDVVLIVPVHVPVVDGTAGGAAGAGLHVLLVGPDVGAAAVGNRLARLVGDGHLLAVQPQGAVHADVEFQRRRRELNALQALVTIVVQRGRETVAQHRPVDHLPGRGRVGVDGLGFLLAELDAVDDIEIAGIGELRVRLEGEVVLGRCGHRYLGRLYGGRVGLVLFVAFHPGAEGRLDGVAVLHALDRNGHDAFKGKGIQLFTLAASFTGGSTAGASFAGALATGGSAAGRIAFLRLRKLQLIVPVGPENLDLLALVVNPVHRYTVSAAGQDVFGYKFYLFRVIGQFRFNPVTDLAVPGRLVLHAGLNRQAQVIGHRVKGADNPVVAVDPVALLVGGDAAGGVVARRPLDCLAPFIELAVITDVVFRFIRVAGIGVGLTALLGFSGFQFLQRADFGVRCRRIPGRGSVRLDADLKDRDLHVVVKDGLSLDGIVIRRELQVTGPVDHDGDELALADGGRERVPLSVCFHQDEFPGGMAVVVHIAVIGVILPDVVTRIVHLRRLNQIGIRVSLIVLGQIGCTAGVCPLIGGIEIVASGIEIRVVPCQQAARHVEFADLGIVLRHTAADLGLIVMNAAVDHLDGAGVDVDAATARSEVVVDFRSVRDRHRAGIDEDTAARRESLVTGVARVGDPVV